MRKHDDLRAQLEKIGRLPVPEPRPEFTDSLLTRLHAIDQLSVAPVPPAAPALHQPWLRMRMIAAGAVAAGILSAVGYITMLRPTEVSVKLTAAFGSAEIVRDAERIPAEEGVELQPGDEIWVGSGSEVHIGDERFAGGSRGVTVVVDKDGDLSTTERGGAPAGGESAPSEVAEEPTTSATAEVTTTTVEPSSTTDEQVASTPVPTESSASVPTTAAPVASSTATVAETSVVTTTVPVTPTAPTPVTPSTLPSTTAVENNHGTGSERLRFEVIDQGTGSVVLQWERYDGEDFGQYVLLTVRGTDETTSYPVGTSRTRVVEVIGDQRQTRFELTLPTGPGRVAYRIAVTNRTTERVAADYGEMLAVSDEVELQLPQPPTTVTLPPSSSSSTGESGAGGGARLRTTGEDEPSGPKTIVSAAPSSGS